MTWWPLVCPRAATASSHCSTCQRNPHDRPGPNNRCSRDCSRLSGDERNRPFGGRSLETFATRHACFWYADLDEKIRACTALKIEEELSCLRRNRLRL